MRQLEVVAVSDDGTQVLLASTEDAVRATHSIRIDNRLQAALRGDLTNDAGRRPSELTPKEIQARLRAGESPEVVAKAAKVEVSRVLRYAGPVISERERIIDQARAAVIQRSRGPEAAMPLGAMIEKRLAVTAGLRPDTVAWTARRRDDGAWIVSLSYSARGGARTATWVWVPADRELTANNPLATRLTADDLPKKGTARKTASPPRKTTPSRKTAPARKAASARKTAPAKKSASARKSAPATTEAATKPKRTTKPRSIPRSTTTVASAKSSNGRAAVPSWDDVLLGVQSPTAARGRRKS